MMYKYEYIEEYEASHRFDSLGEAVANYYNALDRYTQIGDLQICDNAAEELTKILFKLTEDCVVKSNG